MCCCCPSKICTLLICIVLVAVAIGLVFGFGVFKDGFHKLHNHMDIGAVNAPDASRHYYGRRFGLPPF